MPAADLLRAAAGLSRAAALGLLQLLFNAEALTSCGDAGRTAEERDPVLAQWTVADLYFHSRSRFGRQSDHFGAVFRHIGTIPPLPAVKPPPAGKQTLLPKPDLAAVTRHDPPFTQVLESRQSSYRFGPAPISRSQLGEFLHRSARVRWLDSTGVSRRDGVVGEDVMEITSRPYPAGGRGYDLEIYLAIDRCADIDPGLHHYDPVRHLLTCVRPADAKVERLLAYAEIAAPGCRPQVLVILASRFQRLSWKYEAIAYATTLKHVGIVQQTMYLVATAMGLACSALGSGDADAFAEASGSGYLIEGSVGEFILGTRAAGADTASGGE
jgi:SagB-type dehydrogenase family enzyme